MYRKFLVDKRGVGYWIEEKEEEMTDKEKLEQFKKTWIGGRMWRDAQEERDSINMLLRYIDQTEKLASQAIAHGAVSYANEQQKVSVVDTLVRTLQGIKEITDEALGLDPNTPQTMKEQKDAVKEMAARLKTRTYSEPHKVSMDPPTPENDPAGRFRSHAPAPIFNALSKLDKDYEPPV